MVDPEEFRAGDRSYLEKVVQDHQQIVWNVAKRFSETDDDAADLFQETWKHVLSHRDSYDGVGAFGGWLLRVATNVCRMARRKAANADAGLRRAALTGSLDDLTRGFPDPLDQVLTEGSISFLRKELSRMTERERQAIQLRDYDGYTTKEVAQIMGIKEATVRSLVRRAVERAKTGKMKRQ